MRYCLLFIACLFSLPAPASDISRIDLLDTRLGDKSVPQPDSFQESRGALSDHTVRIRSTYNYNGKFNKAYGSGVILQSWYDQTTLERKVLILTAAHVVLTPDKKPRSTYSVDFFHGEIDPGYSNLSIYATSTKLDLGLVIVTVDKDYPAVRIASTTYRLVAGESVAISGCQGGRDPDYRNLKVVDPTISFSDSSMDFGPMDMLKNNGDTGPGDSGGGIHNRADELVGIHVRNGGYAVPLPVIVGFLRANNLGYLIDTTDKPTTVVAATKPRPQVFAPARTRTVTTLYRAEKFGASFEVVSDGLRVRDVFGGDALNSGLEVRDIIKWVRYSGASTEHVPTGKEMDEKYASNKPYHFTFYRDGVENVVTAGPQGTVYSNYYRTAPSPRTQYIIVR